MKCPERRQKWKMAEPIKGLPRENWDPNLSSRAHGKAWGSHFTQLWGSGDRGILGASWPASLVYWASKALPQENEEDETRGMESLGSTCRLSPTQTRTLTHRQRCLHRKWEIPTLSPRQSQGM